MRLMVMVLLLALISGEALAQACVVHSQGERLDVKVCQQNREHPGQISRRWFLPPNYLGAESRDAVLDKCPAGAFGVCSNPQVANMPYRQDIHYYGVATDAAYLKPFCESPEPRNLAQALSH